MKRLACFLMCVMLLLALAACRPLKKEAAVSETSPPAAVITPIPTAPPSAIVLPVETPAPEIVTLPDIDLPVAAEGWAESYIAFLDDNYDIFAALWPEGLTGVGFIDLDIDGTPEMVVFDTGAAATMGVQLFDLVDGQVFCVSSVQEAAAGAFGDEHFSRVSVCTSFFEQFRLTYRNGTYCFWVDSANGTLETSWDEIVRFDNVNGVLTPVSVCARYLESDAETGMVVAESYTVGGETATAAEYDVSASIYTEGSDMGYDAKGVFLWNDMNRYDTTYDGLMAMAEDAAALYVPLGGQ